MKAKMTLVLGVSLLAGCASVSDLPYFQDAESLPDSYYRDTHYLDMPPAHRDEQRRRIIAQEMELERQAACIFGGQDMIFSREGLKCHNVKGTPEYEAKQARIAEMENALKAIKQAQDELNSESSEF